MKIGTADVAKILGIGKDTVRKWAKDGKLFGVRRGAGWEFDNLHVYQFHGSRCSRFGDTLVTRFKLKKPEKRKKTVVPKNVTDVIFVLDRSGSMSGLWQSAKDNLDKYVKELVKASDSDNEYFVSIVNFDTTIERTLVGSTIRGLTASDHYLRPHGSTRLYDAMAEAISICKGRDDGKRAFLVYTLTDGEENASTEHSAMQLKHKIDAATATDRYTFAVAGPHGIGKSMAQVGIVSGNVTEWEQTTRGSAFLGGQTQSAFSGYTQARSVGSTYSTSFYAQPVTPNAAAFASQLDDKLDDVSSLVEVKRVTSSDPIVIKDFCNKKFGSFPKGSIYYQLTESEKIQSYKKVVIQDTATGNFYAGWKSALKLLSIPSFTGTVRIRPGKLGEFKLFVQSTSVNRKLVPGTAVVRLP